MILLAATAAGLAWGRRDLLATFQTREIETGMVFHNERVMRPLEFADRLSAALWGTKSVLACWTLAVVAIRLRPPRPRRARLACQPGMLAVSTATAYALAVAVGFVLAFLIRAKYKPAWSDYVGQAIDAARHRPGDRGRLADPGPVGALACRADLDRPAGMPRRTRLDRPGDRREPLRLVALTRRAAGSKATGKKSPADRREAARPRRGGCRG